MRSIQHQLIALALGSAALVSCVDHRPIRNGLRNESIYLEKTALTAPNPKPGADATDTGWLFKVTVVKASSPNIAGDYAFPGIESDTKYVQWRFREDTLQMLDGRSLQADDPNNKNDNLSSSTERVVMEFGGEHVDIKLREGLDGERTNFLEENTENPWQERQDFRVDFEKTSLDPITSLAWFYGDILHDCARPISTHLLPGSFQFDATDQSMNFVLEVNYELNLLSQLGACYDLVSLATGTGGATIQYRFSFYRPGASDYAPEIIAEKDPVNKKYGTFQILNIFQDPESGLLGAKSLLQRWNPNRTDPVVFYFAPGFPERFLKMFDEIKANTNQILADSGAKLRVDFKNYDADGVIREPGDLRYSFILWHEDIETTRGLLGYGPSSSDPRTGEVISANLNLYNIGMDYYRFLVEDYTSTFGGTQKPTGQESTPWEQISCTPGGSVAPTTSANRLKTALFDEMRRVSNLPEATDTSTSIEDFVPTPGRGWDKFLADYHRTVPELRYADPRYNAYVYRGVGQTPLADFTAKLRKERDFQEAMTKIVMNENPFGGLALSSRPGLEAQQQFLSNFRDWQKNHVSLEADKAFMMGMKNIEVFDAGDALTAITRSARKCKTNGFYESDTEFKERIIESVVEHVAIHEFGHNMGLRHNFYGSIDQKHMKPGAVSASVMDYVGSWEEAATPRTYGGYDEAALKWIYGSPVIRAHAMSEDFLYCTDEHADRSPLCTRHDLGVTPSQIVLNAIERYDWLYAIRNRRAYRTFWDTSNYVNSVYAATFGPLRLWYMAIFDWGGGGVQDTLKRLDQVEDPSAVKTDQEYDEIAQDFYNDITVANRTLISFYDAVINQPASFRNYQTEFDPYYGDVLRLGIILDKLFTTFAFMDLQEVYEYNPNVDTYAALFDSPFGTANKDLASRVLDNMLGAGYDTFPWFKYYALGIFASVTNTNLVNSIEMKERIAIRRYMTKEAFVEEFGQASLDTALAVDNPAGVFQHNGEQYVYTYLADRGWHLIAGRSRNPVSYQFIKDYNDKIRAQGSDTEDNYGLKILLAYYEYYNNFTGF
ncbi:MAG: zinc-dependent metalloprotease [Myxococcota bacterium]